MALTRAVAEFVVIRGCGKILARAGLDGTTVDGTNDDLTDALREGLASLGFGVATLGAVTDADLMPIAPTNFSQFRDIAILSALESALGNLAQPDQMADTDNQQMLGKLRDSIEATVARKQKLAQQQYGYGLGSLTAGVVDLGFAETIDFGTGRPV